MLFAIHPSYYGIVHRVCTSTFFVIVIIYFLCPPPPPPTLCQSHASSSRFHVRVYVRNHRLPVHRPLELVHLLVKLSGLVVHPRSRERRGDRLQQLRLVLHRPLLQNAPGLRGQPPLEVQPNRLLVISLYTQSEKVKRGKSGRRGGGVLMSWVAIVT